MSESDEMKDDNDDDDGSDDGLEKCLNALSQDKIIDEIQSVLDRLGKLVVYIDQKQTFGDSAKTIQLLARMEQLTIASENTTLPELNEHMDHIKKCKKEAPGKGYILHHSSFQKIS